MTLQLPAPEKYTDWRVLSEDEKQGKATGEEVWVWINKVNIGSTPIDKGSNFGFYLGEIIIVPPDYGKQQEPERNADVPVRFDPKCMDAHIFARAAIGAGDMLKVTDGNKTRWCNSCDSVSVWHNRAQYSYPYFAWNDLLVERKTRAEYEQEIAKKITHVHCSSEDGEDMRVPIDDLRRHLEGGGVMELHLRAPKAAKQGRKGTRWHTLRWMI